MSKTLLSHNDIKELCQKQNDKLCQVRINKKTRKRLKCFPIPKGGIPAAYALKGEFSEEIEITNNPKEADFFFDDIIDSGATRNRWYKKYPRIAFLALIDITEIDCQYKDSWIVFPWEGDSDGGIEDNIRRILQYAGDDPNREGLLETPTRVAKALSQWFSGYNKKPEDILKVFKDGGESYDQMVVVKDIPIYSKCEHHMADIFGTATIAYIPNGKIVGLSKLSRLADMYARRLQVQERLTDDIALALHTNLKPKGVAVMIKARHMCMESRGICQQGHHTITTSLRGAFLKESETRAEFMALARQ